MTKLSISALLLTTFFVASCDHKEVARTPDVSGRAGKNMRLSAKEINERVLEHRVDRTLELPEQRFEQRIALLNSLLEESGFSREMVVISIDSSMDAMLKTGLVCPGQTLDHPKISWAVVEGMHLYAVAYEVRDGEIRFKCIPEEVLKRYPMFNRPAPQGP